MQGPDHDTGTSPEDTPVARAPETGEAASGKGPRRPTGRRWITGVLLAFVALTCGLPAYLTATPQQCASCHEMDPYFDSWQASSHAGVATCLDCHVRPGTLLFYELGFHGEIWAHFGGAEVDPGANPPSDAGCLREACHSVNREASYNGELKINHRAHVTEEDISCVECHAGAAHEGVGDLTRLPAVEMCRDCHEDEMDDCTYCHAGKVVPEAPDTH